MMPQRALGEPIKPKQVVTVKQLEEALKKALRAHPECDGIRLQKIMPVTEPGGVANWDAEFGTDRIGDTLTPEQRRMMLAAKLGVQKRLDLAESD
jgi:hypothetical protein